MQPFTGLIACGKKTFESRSWHVAYRGPLLICSGLKKHPLLESYDEASEVLTLKNMYAPKKYRVPKELMKKGHALCVVDMVNIKEFYDTPAHYTGACCDWFPDGYLWELENVRLIEPFVVKGNLATFDVDDSLIKYL